VSDTPRDIFDSAQKWAAALLVLAGALSVVGATLEWVEISVRPQVRSDVDFGDNQVQVEELEPTQPFSGLEAGDGWFVLGAGVMMIIAAGLFLVSRANRYAWLGFLAAVVIGSIAFTDYRGVGDFTSPISRRMEIVGKAVPALGLTLVAAAGLIGLIGAVVGIAASPQRDEVP